MAYRVGPVKVDRVGQPGMVGEADDGLSTTLHHECGPGRDAIISPESGIAPVWVDILGELLNIDLIIPDILSSDGVFEGPDSVS